MGPRPVMATLGAREWHQEGMLSCVLLEVSGGLLWDTGRWSTVDGPLVYPDSAGLFTSMSDPSYTTADWTCICRTSHWPLRLMQSSRLMAPSTEPHPNKVDLISLQSAHSMPTTALSLVGEVVLPCLQGGTNLVLPCRESWQF